jgi:ankyrin repeat protein
MFHAAMSGNVEIAQLLKGRGCTEGYSFAVHGAIIYHHKPMVEWLLNNGATQLDVKDYQGKTPLQKALETNQNEIAELLRQRGATE